MEISRPAFVAAYASSFNDYVPMARRIHIIGSTGSGKTYVADLLLRQLNIPAFDLDDLFWDRSAPTYGVRATADMRDRKLAEIVACDAWIVEGVYHQWTGPSFERAEVILALAPSVWHGKRAHCDVIRDEEGSTLLYLF